MPAPIAIPKPGAVIFVATIAEIAPPTPSIPNVIPWALIWSESK